MPIREYGKTTIETPIKLDYTSEMGRLMPSMYFGTVADILCLIEQVIQYRKETKTSSTATPENDPISLLWIADRSETAEGFTYTKYDLIMSTRTVRGTVASVRHAKLKNLISNT